MLYKYRRVLLKLQHSRRKNNRSSSKQQTQPMSEPKANDFQKGPENVPKDDPKQQYHSKTEIQFIDHVVMIWLNRVRRGDRKIALPSSVLKAKAVEVAKVLNKSAKFNVGSWMRAFKVKMEAEDARGPKRYLQGYLSLEISCIINDERLTFFSKNLPEKIEAKESEEREDSIQTYNEALDCLKLLEDYAISVRNPKATQLMAQIDEFLRKEQEQ